jgi:aldehyde dehydrogenase (NAD+)
VKALLINELCAQIQKQYGNDPLQNSNYGRIVNRKHFDRICSLIDPNKVVIGGKWNENTLQIAPTILDNVTWNDPVMQEEIFGPVLPVLTYRDISEVLTLLANKPKPLALYIFSENKKTIRDITGRCRYGGGCINDCVVHLANSDLEFGGVGESGMGSYHGKAGFDAFSHRKSIMDKKTWIDLPMRYQPYKRKLYDKLVHFFLK